MMLERTIEQKLRLAVAGIGGMCPKFVSPGMDGMPDRIILLPGGRLAFVEVKAPGKIPRPLQVARHTQLRSLGFSVFVLDDPDQIPKLLQLIQPKRKEGDSKPPGTEETTGNNM